MLSSSPEGGATAVEARLESYDHLPGACLGATPSENGGLRLAPFGRNDNAKVTQEGAIEVRHRS